MASRAGGISSSVERELPKLERRVRFPYPALVERPANVGLGDAESCVRGPSASPGALGCRGSEAETVVAAVVLSAHWGLAVITPRVLRQLRSGSFRGGRSQQHPRVTVASV